MSQEQGPVGVVAGMRYDFWFADEGLYRVEFLRRSALELSSGLPFLALLVLDGLVPSSDDPSGLVRVVLLLFAVASTALVPFLLAHWKRRLFRMSFAEVKVAEETKKIPWDEVKSITLTRQTSLRFEMGKGIITQAFRAKIRQDDAERLRGLLQSRVGERFKVREGVLK